MKDDFYSRIEWFQLDKDEIMTNSRCFNWSKLNGMEWISLLFVQVYANLHSENRNMEIKRTGGFVLDWDPKWYLEFLIIKIILAEKVYADRALIHISK